MPGPKKPLPTTRKMTSAESGKALVALWTRDGPLTERELYEGCRFLLANPDLIGGPFGKVIYQVLQHYVEKNPPRPFTAQEVAAMVDQRVNDGMPLAKRAGSSPR